MCSKFALAVLIASTAALGSTITRAYADNIVPNQWYMGQSGAAPNTPLFGFGPADFPDLAVNGPVLPGGFANSIIAPAGTSWTITLISAGTLTVTDVGRSGERFPNVR
jgi:hypothetical protein